MLAEASSELDWLYTLPERFGAEDLRRVNAIARRDEPRLPSCTDNEFAKYMRLMGATLKAKDDDEIAGKLRLRAYQSCLGHHPAAAMQFMARYCIDTMIFFPTISECHDVLKEWVNPLGRTVSVAKRIGAKQQQYNFDDFRDTLRNGIATQEQVDQTPERWRRILTEQGHLRFDVDANSHVIRERKDV